jgi:hypothetical protein
MGVAELQGTIVKRNDAGGLFGVGCSKREGEGLRQAENILRWNWL